MTSGSGCKTQDNRKDRAMRGNFSRALLLPLALLALAVALGACGSDNGSSSGSGGQKGGKLTVLNQGDFEHAVVDQ